MDVQLAVRLPVDVDSVPFARGLLRQALAHARVAPEVVDDLALALTEACANVVQHVDDGDDYEVRVELVGRVCRIAVLDRGPGLDPDVEPTPHGSVLESGRGLWLMRDRVDEVRSETDEDGRHRVVLEKALGDASHPALPL